MKAAVRWGAVLLASAPLASCVVRARPVVVVHERVDEQPMEVVEVREAPPPVKVEVRPAPPHAECIWVEGYWVRTRVGWEWRAGYWVRRPHARAVWVPGHWREGPPHVWRWVPGHWQ